MITLFFVGNTTKRRFIMSVMSVRIDDNKRKALKIIASIEGKSMGSIVTELIENYIDEKKDVLINLSESENLKEIMKMSESSFSEWDNEEDEIYNTL
jgi:predicted DNA-binding protein